MITQLPSIGFFLYPPKDIFCIFSGKFHELMVFLLLFTQSCPTLCNAVDCRTPGVLFTISQSLLRLMSIELMTPSNYLILCRPLLLLPSVFPSIRVFSNEWTVCRRWSKYWHFSFSISPSNECSGLIYFL